jgi:hypothetical protein
MRKTGRSWGSSKLKNPLGDLFLQHQDTVHYCPRSQALGTTRTNELRSVPTAREKVMARVRAARCVSGATTWRRAASIFPIFPWFQYEPAGS